MKTIFEKSKTGRAAYSLPANECKMGKTDELIPQKFLRNSSVELPQVSEADLVKHYTALSKRNFGVD